MKINILSPGRFHVCDLARELARNGHDVKFYSFVTTKRAMKFGLPKECSASLFWPMSPFLALSKKIFPRSQWAAKFTILFQDWLTSVVMRKCDVCIAMSGSFVAAPRKASQHVVRSMLKFGYPKEKLFVNPYGVDLSMFYPDDKVKKEYDVIMVGGWSYRKGCDLIVDAIKQSNYRFLHVGSIVDMEFPQGDERFTHIDAVDQKQLVNYYNKSKLFVFPSREDGFGMVLSQAVACNLPIVGSKDCGAPDLKEMVELPEYIKLIDEYTPQAIKKAIDESLVTYETLKGKVYAGDAISQLTWKAYGERYSEFINKIVRK